MDHETALEKGTHRENKKQCQKGVRWVDISTKFKSQ